MSRVVVPRAVAAALACGGLRARTPAAALVAAVSDCGVLQRRGFSAASAGVVILSEPKTLKDVTSSKPDAKVLAYFTAAWCGPCRMIAPVFTDLAAKHPGITFVKIDIDDNGATAEEAGIRAVPTFQAWSGGVKLKEATGAKKELLEDLVGVLSK